MYDLSPLDALDEVIVSARSNISCVIQVVYPRSVMIIDNNFISSNLKISYCFKANTSMWCVFYSEPFQPPPLTEDKPDKIE